MSTALSSAPLALPSGAPAGPRRLLSTGAFLAGVASVTVVGALVAAYMQVRHATSPFPPAEIDNYLGGTLVVTVLMSAITAEWFDWGVRTSNRRQAIVAGWMTLGFGLAIGNLVWYALSQAGFGPATSPYGALYFAILIVPAVFTAAGFAFMAFALMRLAANQINPSDSDGSRAASLYWHFVVLGWLVASLAIYVFQHK